MRRAGGVVDWGGFCASHDYGYTINYENQPIIERAFSGSFKPNLQTFPNSANVYDSLADADQRSGNKALAIQYYEKALAIDPKFPSSVQAMKRLMAE